MGNAVVLKWFHALGVNYRRLWQVISFISMVLDKKVHQPGMATPKKPGPAFVGN
jgi:hypothetical protein